MDSVIISFSGARDEEIHGVVSEEVGAYEHNNPAAHSYRSRLDSPFVAISNDNHIKTLRDKVNELVADSGRAISDLSLLLIGKSAGAINIYHGLSENYGTYDGFRRIALVLIDPHGAIVPDPRTHCDDYPLSWPSSWPSDTDFFRVYNVYQQCHPGLGGGFTGASFPDSRVYRNIEINTISIDHTNIPMHRISRRMIRCALDFVNSPRGVAGPISIVVHGTSGRDTIDANKEITFHLENLSCNCDDAEDEADVEVWKSRSGSDTLLTNLYNVKEDQHQTYSLPPRGTQGFSLTFKASCKGKSAEKKVFLDYEPPVIKEVTISTTPEKHVILNPTILDDGQWSSDDYSALVKLGGGRGLPPLIVTESQSTVILKNLRGETYSGTMEIIDGFGRHSMAYPISFTLSTLSSDPRRLTFIEPSENAVIRYGSNFDIVVEIKNTMGSSRRGQTIDVFLDGQGEFTKLCRKRFATDNAGWSVATEKCPNIRVETSDTLNWDRGIHKLIAIARDDLNNEVRTERTIRIS